MNRNIIYVYENGSWNFAAEHKFPDTIKKGRYKEVVIGTGWSLREISNMVQDYYQEIEWECVENH